MLRTLRSNRTLIVVFLVVLVLLVQALIAGAQDTEWHWNARFDFQWRPANEYTLDETDVPREFVGSECTVYLTTDNHEDRSIWDGNNILVQSETIAEFEDVERRNYPQLHDAKIVLNDHVVVKFHVAQGSSLEGTISIACTLPPPPPPNTCAETVLITGDWTDWERLEDGRLRRQRTLTWVNASDSSIVCASDVEYQYQEETPPPPKPGQVMVCLADNALHLPVGDYSIHNWHIARVKAESPHQIELRPTSDKFPTKAEHPIFGWDATKDVYFGQIWIEPVLSSTGITGFLCYFENDETPNSDGEGEQDSDDGSLQTQSAPQENPECVGVVGRAGIVLVNSDDPPFEFDSKGFDVETIYLTVDGQIVDAKIEHWSIVGTRYAGNWVYPNINTGSLVSVHVDLEGDCDLELEVDVIEGYAVAPVISTVRADSTFVAHPGETWSHITTQLGISYQTAMVLDLFEGLPTLIEGETYEVPQALYAAQLWQQFANIVDRLTS